MRSALALAALLATCATAAPAGAQALYGKSAAFQGQAQPFIHAAIEAMIAERCGLRTDGWRVTVSHSALARIDRLAAATWPGGGPSRLDAVMQVRQDMDEELQNALATMTADDCETLRGQPAEMRALDAMAAPQR